MTNRRNGKHIKVMSKQVTDGGCRPSPPGPECQPLGVLEEARLSIPYSWPFHTHHYLLGRPWEEGKSEFPVWEVCEKQTEQEGSIHRTPTGSQSYTICLHL